MVRVGILRRQGRARLPKAMRVPRHTEILHNRIWTSFEEPGATAEFDFASATPRVHLLAGATETHQGSNGVVIVEFIYVLKSPPVYRWPG